MSSNSSGADRQARDLLDGALATLHREAPAHHDLLCDALAALTVNLLVGDERFAVEAVRGRLATAGPARAARVTLETDLATACALLDARRTVVQAVRAGELDVRGSAGDLAAVADALSLLLHGLVRCPSSAALLDELRRHACNER